MHTDERRWTELLDEFESVMDRQRTAIEVGDVTVDGLVFSPPNDLPPLPTVLTERARRLAAANAELVRVAAEAAERIRPAGRQVTRRAVARPTITQLDLRA